MWYFVIHVFSKLFQHEILGQNSSSFLSCQLGSGKVHLKLIPLPYSSLSPLFMFSNNKLYF